MRIDFAHDPNSPRCRVFNLDTGAQITFCALADEETGEYEQYRRVDDRFVIEDNRPVIDRGRCNLKIVPLLPGEPYIAEACP
jgi:hypothetical protein